MSCVADAEKTLPAPLVAPVKAISNHQWDWNSHSVNAAHRPVLKVRACAGQFEPASFLLMCPGGLDNLMVEATPFCARADDAGDATHINAEVRLQGRWQPTIDIRWVKRWWQSGRYYYEADHPVFVPELLLHDESLVKSSHEVPLHNEYPELPQDAEMLQPMRIPHYAIGFTQQVWVTVYVPEGTPPGTYWSTMTITSEQTPQYSFPMKLYVWPFELYPPAVDYSIFYRPQLRGELEEGEAPPISATVKTPMQMKADLANMVRHGITNPQTYVPPGKDLIRVLGMRRAVGCDNSRIFNLSCHVGGPALEDSITEDDLVGLKTRAAVTSHRLLYFYRQRWGVREFFRFGKDEGVAEEVAKQVALWESSREGGTKVAVTFSGFKNFEEHIGTAVDVVVSNQWPTLELVRELHDRGVEIYLYGNPQCGNEEPETYRRNWGIRTLALDCDGSMGYAYQHILGGASHAWDDMAALGGDYRSHMCTYPTADGCVDTLQWEGVTAAVNDVRYLTTLQAAIEETDNRELALEAQAFIDECYEEATIIDLDAVRQQCTQWIIKLQGGAVR